MERVGFDRSINPEAVAMLHREARRYLPGLYSGELAEAWIGFRPAADGPEPVVRRVPETDVWLAYGHLRNGILLAPVTAKMVTADLVSSQFL
jgi:glycine/D-amino acid oxidase-like deaminating enzyme